LRSSVQTTPRPAALRDSDGASSQLRVGPAHRAAGGPRHDAVELPRPVGEHQRQEVPVAGPHGYLAVEHVRDQRPDQGALVGAFQRGTGPLRYPEHEAEPGLVVATEAGPGDRAGQFESGALQPRLLADLAAHTGADVLVGFQLAAEAVVLAEVEVVRPALAPDHL